MFCYTSIERVCHRIVSLCCLVLTCSIRHGEEDEPQDVGGVHGGVEDRAHTEIVQLLRLVGRMVEWSNGRMVEWLVDSSSDDGLVHKFIG